MGVIQAGERETSDVAVFAGSAYPDGLGETGVGEKGALGGRARAVWSSSTVHGPWSCHVADGDVAAFGGTAELVVERGECCRLVVDGGPEDTAVRHLQAGGGP